MLRHSVDRFLNSFSEATETLTPLAAMLLRFYFILLFVVAFAAGLAVWAVFKELAKFGAMWL